MHIKKLRKTAIIVTLAAAMAFSLTACGNPDSKETTAATTVENNDDAAGALKIKKDLENQALDAINGSNNAIEDAEKIADPNSDY